MNDHPIFIHVIGSIPDELCRTNKLANYALPTNGILIKNFSTNVLGNKPENVHILAYGEKKNYDIYRLTNNKCYFQLDLEHYYQLDFNSTPFFSYYSNYDDIMTYIDGLLEQKPTSPVVLVFDDHGSKGFFASISYIELYSMIMSKNKNKFLVLNDTCSSGSLIYIVKIYNHIFNIRKDLGEIKLCSLVSISNLTINVLGLQDENEKSFAQVISQSSDFIDFFQKVSLSSEEEYKKIHQIIENYKGDESYHIPNDLEALGFKSIEDILNFIVIIGSLHQEKKRIDFIEVYDQCKRIFTQDNFKIFEEALKYDSLSVTNLTVFNEVLNLFINKDSFDFSQTPHPNLEIVSSTDMYRDSLTYSSIRVNEVIKVIPGSPIMSSFIKEMFMKLNGKPFSFENIIKDTLVNEKGYLQFPGRVEHTEGEHKMKQWIHLNPLYFKEGDYEFRFEPCPMLLKIIPNLRSALHLTSKKLTEISAEIAPDFQTPIKSNEADLIGDIVALTAACKDIDRKNVLRYIKGDGLELRSPNQINMIASIVFTSLTISKDPIKMAAMVCHILNEAAKQTSKEKVNAIFTLMSKEAIILSFIIASHQLKEGSINEIVDQIRTSDNMLINFIREIKNEEQIISFSERCLLAYASYGLEFIDKVCYSNGIAGTADLVLKCTKRHTGLSTLCYALNNSKPEERNEIEKFIFDVVLKEMDKPLCLQLSVLGTMSYTTMMEAVIVALYEWCLSHAAEAGPPKDFKERVKTIFCSKKHKDNYFAMIFTNLFGSQTFNDKSIKSMKENVIMEAQIAFKKVNEIFSLFEKNALINLERGVLSNYNDLKDRTNKALKSIKKRITLNGSRVMLAIEDFAKILTNLRDLSIAPNIQELILGKGFENPSPFNLASMVERAVNEMLSISDILSISDQPYEEIKSPEEESMLSIKVIAARACNVVEMRPIMDYVQNDPSNKELKRPINVDEIMALATGTKYYPSGKDLTRERSRYREYDENQIQSDDYYSSSFFEDPYEPIIRRMRTYINPCTDSSSALASPSSSPCSSKDKSGSSPKPHIISSSDEASSCEDEEEYSEDEYLFKPTEDYGGHLDLPSAISMKIGRSTWYLDGWRFFVYRFNKRVEHLGICYDPNTKYTGTRANLGRELKTVLKFYPVTQIRKFDDLYSNFCCFVYKNMKHIDVIREEFVKAFDDTDQTVTQYYFNKMTMQRG